MILSIHPPHRLSLSLPPDGAEPEYKADSEYPPWVFSLLDEKPLLEDFVMNGLDKVPPPQMKLVFRMANKRRLKANNAAVKKEK